MTTLEILSSLFLIAALFGLISKRWLKLPLTVGTMLLTVVTSLLLGAVASLAPHLHHWAVALANDIDFEAIILHGMLPLLLFAGAFLFDVEELAKQKLPVTLLAVVGTLISIIVVAGLMTFRSL